MEQDTGGGNLLAPWRLVQEERSRQAVAALASVQGVLGLILAGSVGRGEAWPLSDIDLIPIYDDERTERAAGAVENKRLALLDWWTAEGYCTSLDVGKLHFTRAEVMRALAGPPDEATRYLDDLRWFHSLDKGYQGRPAFDPEGLAGALTEWLTAARVALAVVRGRLAMHQRQALERYLEARTALTTGDTVAATIAWRESLHASMRYLIEQWGGRDNSFARLGTRFERLAAERGERGLAATIMAWYGLTPDEVTRRMAVAPEGIRYRHRLSLAARHLVGESVTAEEDARDVLLVFSTMAIRRGRPPFASWVGLATDPADLDARLSDYGRLLERLANS